MNTNLHIASLTYCESVSFSFIAYSSIELWPIFYNIIITYMWALPVDWKPSVSLENDIKFVKVFPIKENEWSAYKWRQQINLNGKSDPRERDNSGGLKQHENLLSAFNVEIENWSLNSVPAFECKWGWGWPCFDINLFPFLMEIMLKKYQFA